MGGLFTDNISGAGDSNFLLEYDYEVVGENKYYKLTQVDYNGSVKELGIVPAFCENEGEFKVYPNPVEFGQSVIVDRKFEKISVKNINGKDVNFRVNNNEINDLPRGINLIIIDEKFKLIVIVF